MRKWSYSYNRARRAKRKGNSPEIIGKEGGKIPPVSFISIIIERFLSTLFHGPKTLPFVRSHRTDGGNLKEQGRQPAKGTAPVLRCRDTQEEHFSRKRPKTWKNWIKLICRSCPAAAGAPTCTCSVTWARGITKKVSK